MLGEYLITIGYAAITWLFLAGIFVALQNVPKAWFVPIHLIGVVIIMTLSSWLYMRWFHYFSPFHTMVVFMLTIFALEAVVFGFLYPPGRAYLNFWDYIVPVFLGATTLYFALGYFI